jgi:hypothetical protein
MKISTVYDAIISSLEALFPSKQRLHNPYELSDNPELIAKDSWGLKVGSASREEIDFCTLSIGREFTLILIRQFATVGSKNDAFDVISKLVLEDQQTALNKLWSPTELSQQTIIDQITFESIGGIDFQETNQKKYLFCEITFRITMSEQLI